MNSIVVAYDRLGTIGRDNELPWRGKLPADMRRFRMLTVGSAVVMGRKTYESLPSAYRPLPDRDNIVVSLSRQALQGALVTDSIEAALAAANNEAMVIGGAQIYEQALPYVDRVYATEIDTATEGGDAFFPTLDMGEWKESNRVSCSADINNAFNYSFVMYDRRSS